MKIIEIKTLENGSHRNQSGEFIEIPNGWAIIPDEIDIPETFPFVNIKVKDGVVTSMVAGTVPESTKPEQKISPLDQMRADIDFIAAMTGVEL